MRAWGLGLAGMGLLAALLALYGPHVARAGFVYEDGRLVAAGAAGRPWASILTGRGLTRWTWTRTRTSAASHALSLALHVAAVGLLGLLAWQLTGSGLVAGAAAGVAALHPLQIQAVAYAAERDDLIAAVGVLLAAVWAASWRAWWLVPVGIALAYAGKETGIVAGAVVLLVWAVQGRLREEWLYLTGFAAWIGILVLTNGHPVSGIYDLVNIGESDMFATVTAWEWLRLQATAVYRLLVQAVLPVGLTPDPDIAIVPWAGQVFAVVALAGLVEIAWRLWRRAPLVAFGLALALVSVALRLVVQTPWNYLNGGHGYVALCGLSLAASGTLFGARVRMA